MGRKKQLVNINYLEELIRKMDKDCAEIDMGFSSSEACSYFMAMCCILNQLAHNYMSDNAESAVENLKELLRVTEHFAVVVGTDEKTLETLRADIKELEDQLDQD